MAESFDEFEISFDMLQDNPQGLMQHEDLIVQIEHKFYDWKNAAPLIMSFLVFKQPISLELLGKS